MAEKVLSLIKIVRYNVLKKSLLYFKKCKSAVQTYRKIYEVYGVNAVKDQEDVINSSLNYLNIHNFDTKRPSII